MKNLFGIIIVITLSVQINFAQWYPIHPLGKSNLNSVCYSENNNVFVVDDKGFLNFSADNGLNWVELQIASNTSLNAITFADHSLSLIVGDKGNIFISETNWKDWQDISVDDYFQLKDVKFIRNGRGVAVGSKEVVIEGKICFLPSILLTNNYGSAWKEIKFNFRGILNSVIYSEKGLIIAVGGNGLMLYSSDSGNSWSREYLRTDVSLNSVRLCPDNTLIIAGDKGTFFYSQYPGEKWKKIQLPEFYNFQSACFRERGIVIAAGKKYMEKESGIFTMAALVKIDLLNNTWSEEFAKIYGNYNSVSFCNPYIAIAVGECGTVAVYNHTTNFEDPFNSAVNNFQLHQNHPNPFNPSTKISWQLPVSGDVTLKVFDILGNVVATLVDEHIPSGRYEVEFDGGQLSSGVYFYQLKVREYNTLKKMILLK